MVERFRDAMPTSLPVFAAVLLSYSYSREREQEAP